MRWIEKERLWILKTSPIDMRKYVKQIFRARVSPLLLSQTPIIIAIGIFFVATRPIETSLQIIIVLPAALQISALMMGGSMYFAAKYGQSTTDDILETQTQELVDIKRFIYQAIINLALVAPLMALVTSYERVAMFFQGGGAAIPLILMLTLSLAYSWIILNIVLGKAGNSINSREDL